VRIPGCGREFIAGLGGTVAWPFGERAQPQAVPVIGFIGSSSPDVYAYLVRAFRQGLGEAGYVEGRNVTIERPRQTFSRRNSRSRTAMSEAEVSQVRGFAALNLGHWIASIPSITVVAII
jgi:hypothetical protein